MDTDSRFAAAQALEAAAAVAAPAAEDGPCPGRQGSRGRRRRPAGRTSCPSSAAGVEAARRSAAARRSVRGWRGST